MPKKVSKKKDQFAGYSSFFSLQNPEETVARLWATVPQYIKLTFISACILGFTTHFYVISRKLPNHDDIGQLLNATYGTASGRWLLPFVMNLDGSFSTPWLIGVLSILTLAVAACFVVSLMRIRLPLGCILTTAVMVTFPTVTATMTYMFSADAYFFSLTLACCAAYITEKYRLGFIGGIFAIAFSMGIYQSYFGMTAVLMAGILLFNTLDGELPLKRIIFKGFRFLATLALGMILYVIIVKLTTLSTDLVDYMGISEMGHISISQIPQLITKAYLGYLKFFIKSNLSMHFPFIKYAFTITAVSTVYLGIVIIRGKKLKSNYILLLILLVLVYPFAGDIIYVMAPNAYVHLLMVYGLTGILIAPLALMEYYLEFSAKSAFSDGDNCRKNICSICCWIIVGTIMVTTYKYTILSNEAYLKMELTYEQTYSFSTRLLGAIENTDGYDTNTPIVLVGSALDNVLYTPTPELDKIVLTGVADMKELVNSYTYGYFLRRFIGASNIIYSSDSELSVQYKNTNEVRNMPNYPIRGSIKEIEGLIIVKLS